MGNVALFLAVGIVGSFFFGSANAEEAVGSGVGVDTSCAQYTELAQHDPQAAHFAFLSWSQGFMTGFNFSRLKDGKKAVNLRAIDQAQLEAALRKGCTEDPSRAFLSVVIDIYQHLAELEKVKL